MPQLGSKNKDKALDLLNERCAFERTGVKLYDAIIAKMRKSTDGQPAGLLDQMQEHRDQEKEHEEWLEQEIRSLGGNPHAETDKVRLVETESKGITEVILDGDPDIVHLFHALLLAELADNAGWDLLVQLADQAGDKRSKREFEQRLHDEQEHLVLVKRAVEAFARREVLGQPASLPAQP
jgi:bacterioferritin (cytochrome b1)